MTADITRLDVPLGQVEPAAILLEAAARTNSPSDRIGDANAAWLVAHPDAVPCEVPDGWADRIAAQVALNEKWSEVAAFNFRYPPGTPVTAYPAARPEDDADCERLETTTRTAATVLQGHTPVVWVHGHGACIALTHIDIRTGGAS